MKSTPTFVAYIDESGDEGFSFDHGSSEWFILSAVITGKASDLETVKLVDRVRAQLNKPPRKPLHFRKLKHEQRLLFVGEIATAHLCAISVLVHKPSLKEPGKFQERYRLYFYSVRYLLERISWYCRDHRTVGDEGDGSVEIIFSNRSGMSYEELKEYLLHLKNRTGSLDVRVEWSVVRSDQITTYTPGRRMGLQIADAIASSSYYAVQPSQYGFTEGRYICMLKPIIYHYNGRYLGYGLKFWPREVNTTEVKGQQLKWLQDKFR